QALALLAGPALLGQHAPVDHAAEPVAEPGLRGHAVAARTAGLRVVALDRLGQVDMGDEAHVGLVDAHAEGDRRHHHHAVALQEPALVLGAYLRLHAGVVGQGVDAGLLQLVGDRLDPAAGEGIDDPTLAAVAGQEVEQRAGTTAVLLHDGVADVGPVEGAGEAPRVLQAKALGDLLAGGRVGRGGQRDARHVG